MVVPVQPAVRIGPERGGHNGPAQHIFAKIPRKVEFLKKMDNVLKQCVEIALLPTAWQRHEAAAGKVKLNAHTSWKWAKPEKRKELEDRCRDDPSKLDEQGRHKGGAGNKKAGKHVKRMGEVNGPWFEEQETEIVRKILSERTNRSRVGSRGVRNWMRDLVRRATNLTADNVERAMQTFHGIEGMVHSVCPSSWVCFQKENKLPSQKHSGTSWTSRPICDCT